MYRVTVPTKPVGKQRPRLTRAGRAYTPAETVRAENWVRLCCLEQAGRPCLEGPISVRVEVVLAVPRSWSQRARAEALAGAWAPRKPDADNVVKLVMDALIGLAWLDDAQVVELAVRKCYGPEPGLRIEWAPVPERRKQT